MPDPTTYPVGLDPEDLDFYRRYGPWQPFTVEEAAELFDQIGIDWWIAGGVAIEAFTGVHREHEDIDISIFRRDVPRLRLALDGRYHVWSAAVGALRPVNDRFPDIHPDADQVWLREHAMAPWRADVVVNPDREGLWVSRRDPEFAAPLSTVTWVRDGVRYLRPEIGLSFKAKQLRPKDQHDFAAALPLLDERAREFLADYLARKEPEHPWRERL